MKDINKINFLERRLLEIDDSYYIYLTGGFANGTVDCFSDMDFIIFCTEIPPDFKRQEAIKLGQFYYTFKDTDIILFKERKVDFTYIGEKKLLDIIRNRNTDFLNYIINTKPLSKTHKLIEKEKQKFDPSEFIYHSQEIKTKLEYLEKDLDKLKIATKRNDIIYINYLVNYFTERILKVLYSMNDKLYIYPKKSIKVLEELNLPKGILENLIYISEQPNFGDNIYTKIETIKESIGLLKEYINENCS